VAVAALLLLLMQSHWVAPLYTKGKMQGDADSPNLQHRAAAVARTAAT
jgi:predicted cobalt transporter CbtA